MSLTLDGHELDHLFRLRERGDPSPEDLEEWLNDGYCEATDGCAVEPDGTCEHGAPSWLLQMGMI